MEGINVLFWLLLSGGIICVSLATEETSDDNSKRGSHCTNNNGGQWLNEATGHFLYECTGSKIILKHMTLVDVCKGTQIFGQSQTNRSKLKL